MESGLTRTDWIMGSPQYMAPEQASGRTRGVGPAADVYALGAILYELLTGRPPFRAATVLDTLEQVKNAEPVPPGKLQPGLARDLETICLKCLQKDPSRRYATAGELAEDLGRWRTGTPINARPIPFWERGWRWARHRPAVAALSALIVLISAVSFGLVAWLWARAEERADAAVVARDCADRLARQESEARRATQTERQKAVDSLYRALVGEASALRLAQDGLPPSGPRPDPAGPRHGRPLAGRGRAAPRGRGLHGRLRGVGATRLGGPAQRDRRLVDRRPA